jgi:hypothetical protein
MWSGGHGNLWVVKADGSAPRAITFERDPAVAVGVPIWSTVHNRIAFVLTRGGQTGLWLINSDGSNLHQLVPAGAGANWSADGRWLYYVSTREGRFQIEKIPAEGGTPVLVRSDNAVAPAAGHGLTFFYATISNGLNGGWDFELRRVDPRIGVRSL